MTLTMLHVPLSSRALFAVARAQGLADDAWSVDLGYLVHALFAQVFEGMPLKPFDVQERTSRDGDRLSVLAYGTEDHLGLAARARPGTDGHAAIAWPEAASKPMPSFAAGNRLGFRLRVCPAIRVGRTHPRFEKGAEVDPYVALVQRNPDAAMPPREAVYRDWLAARLGSAATLEGARLVALRDAHLWRKGKPTSQAAGRIGGRDRPRPHGRALLGRRTAVFEGELTVGDPAAFTALLARGVGRHRAFGFGMLLLRPPAA